MGNADLSGLDHYEQTHDYDEYHYELDVIGHDPYVLTAILSAMHPGEWTLQEVTGTLDMLFDKQYILTETVASETRYRTETVTGERHARDPVTGVYLFDQWGYPIMEEYEYEAQVSYTYQKCTVKLENFDLSHVPVYVMNEETLGRYAIYMATLGNRPDLFPDSDYIRQMLIEGYTKYDLPPEALENARFPCFGFLLICQEFRLRRFTHPGIRRTARILCELEARLLAGHLRLLFRRDLRQLGGHDAIQLQICGEVIDERENDIAIEQQSFTFTGICMCSQAAPYRQHSVSRSACLHLGAVYAYLLGNVVAAQNIL